MTTTEREMGSSRGSLEILLSVVGLGLHMGFHDKKKKKTE